MLTAIAQLDEAFTLGDVPAPFVVEVERENVPVNLTGLNVTAALLPDVPSEDDPTFTVASGGGSLTVQLPELKRDGIRALQLVVSHSSSAPLWSEAVAALPFIADTRFGVWHSIASARAEWQTGLPAVTLYRLLRIARQAVEAYAPPSVLLAPFHDDSAGQERLAQAQLAHARNLANAALASPSGDLEGDSYALVTRPLDWHVKQLLRPAGSLALG